MSSKGLTKVFSSIVEKVKYTGFSERELRELEEEFLLHLVENDVALEVAEALLRELTSKLSSVKVSRFADKGRVALEVL
ncbi:MAG: signal recognition particle receptor subunit alpha, partial [Thermofilum sp.]